MTDTSPSQTPAGQIPPDAPARRLATASPARDQSLEHLGVVGDIAADDDILAHAEFGCARVEFLLDPVDAADKGADIDEQGLLAP